MSSPQIMTAAATADLSESLFSDVSRAVERVRHPVKQEFFARSKDFDRLKVLLAALENDSRRKDTELQRVCQQLEQTKYELAVSEGTLYICSKGKAELEARLTASKELHAGAMLGQLCLIEAAEAMIENTREELEEKASEQAAELAATKVELDEVTAALRAAEEKNESLLSAIEEAESLCSL